MSRLKSMLIVLMIWALSLSIGSMVGGSSYAEEGQAEDISGVGETSASNKKLKKTWIQTQGIGFVLTSTFANAFTPTSIKCPVTAGCTIRVEVASQFWGLGAGNVIRMRVRVDGSGTGVTPLDMVNVDSTSTGNWASTRTFSWMKKGVTQGNHTVTVDFQVNSGTALAGARTQTIEVYKGPN